MSEFYNSKYLDIGRFRWGAPPVPLLPRSLCRVWQDEPLPTWLKTEAGLSSNETVAALGPSFWDAKSAATPRLEHYVLFLIRSRAESILTIKCFDRIWPGGLRLAEIPFSVRSMNLLRAAGFIENPAALVEATFGQLLRVPGLGAKCLVEITTLTESAIDVHERVIAELSMGLAGAPSDTPETATQRMESCTRVFTEILEEPWVDQITDQDPRFSALLPPGNGTLEERIDRVISDPAAAAADVPALLARLPLIRESVQRITSEFLEDSLLELLSATIGRQRSRLDVIAARLGWRGEEPKTLQQCGDSVGLTRERVRQIENKALERLPTHPILLPKLDLGISLLESAAPITVREAAQLLADRGVSRRAFSPVSLLEVAERFGRKSTLSISDASGEPFVVSASKQRTLGATIRVARRLAGQAGVASVFQVADSFREFTEIDEMLDLPTQVVTEEEARIVLAKHSGCEFLNQDWFWFTDIPEGRNRLANISRRILCVASPQSVSSIREGVRRGFRHRSLGNPRYQSLAVPPHSVMTKFFERHPDFRLEGDSVASVKQLDYRNLLGEGERAIVDVFRVSSSGVLDRKTLVEACIGRGVNENTLSVYTSYSPILEHIGLDLWKLRGVRVDPSAVEAVREQNQLRPRETRLLEYGWTADGSLWIAWKLPAGTSGLVLGIPGAVRRYICDRNFQGVAKNSARVLGQISINETGSSYGYGTFLRYMGADEGDTLLAEFNLANSRVQLSMVDEEMVE